MWKNDQGAGLRSKRIWVLVAWGIAAILVLT